MLEFIKGNLNDLPEIIKLDKIIFEGMYKHKPYTLEDYQKRLKDKKPIIYLVKDNNNFVGYSIAFEQDGQFYLWILGVIKEFRNKGIGNKLINKNKEEAVKNNFKSIFVKVYDVSREMQKLLIKNGFQIEKTNNINGEFVKFFRLNLS